MPSDGVCYQCRCRTSPCSSSGGCRAESSRPVRLEQGRRHPGWTGASRRPGPSRRHRARTSPPPRRAGRAGRADAGRQSSMPARSSNGEGSFTQRRFRNRRRTRPACGTLPGRARARAPARRGVEREPESPQTAGRRPVWRVLLADRGCLCSVAMRVVPVSEAGSASCPGSCLRWPAARVTGPTRTGSDGR